MNERIKELALQATEVVPEKVWDENNGMYYSENRSRLDPEKFAELIVRECISALEEKIHRSIDHEGDEIWADLILKEHFGVEE